MRKREEIMRAFRTLQIRDELLELPPSDIENPVRAWISPSIEKAKAELEQEGRLSEDSIKFISEWSGDAAERLKTCFSGNQSAEGEAAEKAKQDAMSVIVSISEDLDTMCEE